MRFLYCLQLFVPYLSTQPPNNLSLHVRLPYLIVLGAEDSVTNGHGHGSEVRGRRRKLKWKGVRAWSGNPRPKAFPIYLHIEVQISPAPNQKKTLTCILLNDHGRLRTS